MSKFVTLLAVSLASFCAFSGCGQVKKDLQQAKKDIQGTKTRTQSNLKKIQQRGAVDLEVQQCFDAVYEAYVDFELKNGSPPERWSDLLKVAKKAGWVDEAKRRDLTMNWGVSISAYKRANAEDYLLYYENRATISKGWGQQVGGDIVELDPRQLEKMKMAGKEVPKPAKK